MLFGWWLARRPEPRGGTVVTVTLRCPDGVYLSDVRTLDRNGKLRNEQQGVGDWGISGPVYFTIEHERRGPGGKHRDLDMTRERNYTAYRILGLSYTSFKYRSWSNGAVVDAHRASPDELSDLNDQTGAMQLPASCGGSGD